MYRFDGSTVLAIKTDVTHTVTHQTTHILPPAGTQNALGESHKKASTQQAARRTGVLARCRRAHCARFGRWRSQKHRWWPSAGVSGGGRDLTLRADDLTSLGRNNPTQRHHPTRTTQLKSQPTQPNTKQPHSKHDSPVGPSATPCTDGRPSENTPPWTGLHQSSLPNAAEGYPTSRPRAAVGSFHIHCTAESKTFRP